MSINREEKLQAQVSPFLKWAGGKRNLISQLLQFTPQSFGTFNEPFLGAGSMFFSMASEVPKYVNDYNDELILTYKALRDDVTSVINELQTFAADKESYLSIRSWDRNPAFGSVSIPLRAARFIYLNKVGFNGLYRLNRAGYFNVPFGSGGNKDFVTEGNLLSVNAFLNQKNEAGELLTHFSNVDIVDWELEGTQESPFTYFDPPYFPVSATAGFVDYNENGFGSDKQEIVRDKALDIAKNGGLVMISNSDTEFIRKLYSNGVFKTHTVNVRRSIAAKASSRGVTTELVITNYSREGSIR